ncbi:hypothetical protein ACQE3E_05915 [Methylomonas sp. MED-D]|uniref:hypothetical protein n=1 Tax=unclassified Methylomonas TaxID=2608980 RepID=UPI0028A43931|nr:hypothetical protein [Methylomonas sp. MV1]MDT4329490.1 hypothetical protein [Methylomonas sp. MV1]
MLEEAWHYLGTRAASPAARRLGYVREAAALETRHRRCRDAWQPHIQATRAALLTSADRLETAGGTALIVGGGIARDLPLADLLTRFQQVVLLDIVFGRATRRLARRWPGRVGCCYWDVTGTVEWLAERRRIPPDVLVSRPSHPELSAKPAWVASVNCLMQLPLMPIAWLATHGIGEADLEAFGQRLVEAHLDWLTAWQVPCCLITEVCDTTYDAAGQRLSGNDYRPLLARLPATASLAAQWEWFISPPGEPAGGGSDSLNVEVWEF